MARPRKSAEATNSYINKIETEIQSNQSKLNMVLGALIILVVGILIFNYFNKSESVLGPAQNTSSQEQQDIEADKLPGKYIVKKEDTLFVIAQKYYNDGYKYTEIATANNIADADNIEEGQILEIPKLETITPAPDQQITATTYTVVEGDWLSTIAGRAYGDIYAYQKIADANNITNPDLIEPGQVLTIPAK